MTDETSTEGATSTGKRSLFRRHRVITVAVGACVAGAAIGVPIAFAAGNSTSHPAVSWASFNARGDEIGAWMNTHTYDENNLQSMCVFIHGASTQLKGWVSPDAPLNSRVSGLRNELDSLRANGCGSKVNTQAMISDSTAIGTSYSQIATRLAIVDPHADAAAWLGSK